MTALITPTTLNLSQSRSLRYVVFGYLYFMQGLPSGFALTALTNYLTAQHVSPSLVGSFVALVGLPWAFQFVWGPLIDRFRGPGPGGHKRWVIGSQCMAFVASLGVLLVHDPLVRVPALGVAFMIHSVFAGIQDTSVDAMAISVIPESERGRVNAFMRAGFLLGIGLGAALFSHILRDYGFFRAALTQSACLLILTLLTFFVREYPNQRLFSSSGFTGSDSTTSPTAPAERNFRWLFAELFAGLFSRRSVLLFGATLLSYVSVSLFIRSYNYHLIQRLGWPDTDVSVLTGTYGLLVATGVALLGGYLADRIGSRRLLLLVMAVVAAYLLTFNALAEWWIHKHVAQTGLISLYFMDPAISTAAMPMLMALCRKGVEGSQFTTYMALVNLSDVAGSFVAGQALVFVSAPTIGLFAGGLAFAGMLMMLIIRRTDHA